MADDRQPEFRLTLRALPAEAPAMVRLRRFLKAALRWYGLKCISAIEVPPTPAGKDAPP